MIVLWLLVLVLGVIAILSLTRFGATLSVKIVHVKSLKWVWGIYISFLLLAVAILYLLPRTGFLPSATARSDIFSKVFEAAQKGRLDHTKGLIAKRQWSFTSSGDLLTLTNDSDTMIMVQRKSGNDGKIDAAYYPGQCIAYFGAQGIQNRIDFSNMIEPPSLVLEDNKLTVTNPHPYYIDLAIFKPDFTVSQFSSGNTASGSGSDLPGGVILLRIPKNLKLDAQGNLQYIS